MNTSHLKGLWSWTHWFQPYHLLNSSQNLSEDWIPIHKLQSQDVCVCKWVKSYPELHLYGQPSHAPTRIWLYSTKIVNNNHNPTFIKVNCNLPFNFNWSWSWPYMNTSVFISSADFAIKFLLSNVQKVLFSLSGVFKFKANIKFTFPKQRINRTNSEVFSCWKSDAARVYNPLNCMFSYTNCQSWYALLTSIFLDLYLLHCSAQLKFKYKQKNFYRQKVGGFN